MTGASADAAPARARRVGKPRDETGAVARRDGRHARAASGATGEEASGKAGRFARRAGNYRKTILWSVHDTFAPAPRKLVVALILGGAGLMAQALAILIVVGYGQALQRDGGLVIPALGIEWSARTETALLIAVAGGVAASLATAALLGFASNGLLLSVMRQGLARAVERMARAARSLPDPRAPRASMLLADFTLRGLTTAATASARSAFLIVKTVPALAGALLATIVLFWQAPVLTAILFAVATIWSALLYPVSLRAVAFGRRLRRAGATIRADLTRIPSTTGWAPADELATAYAGWLRTGSIIALVVGIGIAVILAIALAVMGAELMSGARDWTVLIAYVGALQVALNGVFRTIRAVAFVSRRYPEMVRHRQFVLDEGKLSGPTASPRHGDLIHLGATEEGEPVVATIGERLAIISDDVIQKVQLVALRACDSNGTPIVGARSSRAAPASTREDAPILFAEARLLAADPGHRALSATDGLVIVVHSTPALLGSFGETRLLVVDGHEIVGCVAIGSKEADAVLARAARRAARSGERKAKSSSDSDEDYE
ncbi:MAG: hypothetical protein KIS68_00710 [Bauldia sp.]|nr:hypothetical protein [Bauldia sp.]